MTGPAHALLTKILREERVLAGLFPFSLLNITGRLQQSSSGAIGFFAYFLAALLARRQRKFNGAIFYRLAISTTIRILSELEVNQVMSQPPSPFVDFFFCFPLALVVLALIPASARSWNAGLQSNPQCLSSSLSRVSTHKLTLVLSTMLIVFAEKGR